MYIGLVVTIIGHLAFVLAGSMALCAFMLPRGWTSPLGILILTMAAYIVVASTTHDPSTGLTWTQVALYEAFAAY